MTTYKEAGVDIDAADAALALIKPIVRSTFTPGVLTDIGAFGAFFRPDLREYEEPVLVSSVDGVGTKLKVAAAVGRHDTVGQDLVNHCVNDIAVCGAVPLFFLDYFGVGQLDPEMAAAIVSGFASACTENGCALVGGETAEMPGVYAPGDYDLAGTIVGLVDRSRIITGEGIQPGDVIIGLPSTGLHTNGFSLARRVLLDRYRVDDRPERLGGAMIGDSMLAVHRSYLKAIRALVERDLARGLVHVTGGGIPGNTPRVVRSPLAFEIDYDAWERPAIFSLIQETGAVPEDDMRRTFNLGIGLLIISAPGDVGRCMDVLATLGEKPQPIGSVK
jgi:phosphoribosylformylglycinamidine cyclo-ligase